MNGKKAKQVKKIAMTEEVLMIIRNHYGELTQKMGPHQIRKAAKKLYKKGLIKV